MLHAKSHQISFRRYWLVSETQCIRLMGRYCFRRLNPEGYELAFRRFEERQGRASTIAYLTANLHKKADAKRSAELALGLAEHLDDLQDQLGERVRQKLGIDLWQAVRDGGQLKLVTETARGAFNTTYATVSGYRLIDPARKKLAPALRTAIKSTGLCGALVARPQSNPSWARGLPFGSFFLARPRLRLTISGYQPAKFLCGGQPQERLYCWSRTMRR